MIFFNSKNRNVANGEILGVTLMMEDLLNNAAKNEFDFTDSSNLQSDSIQSFSQSNSSNTNKPQPVINAESSRNSIGSVEITLPKRSVSLITNYNRWRHFLLTWKRLELLKLDWGRRKLGVENLNNSEIYSRFW